MSLQQHVYSVLIVSASEVFNSAAAEIITLPRFQPVHTARDVSKAKRDIAARSYDLIIINSPLPDDSGTGFAIDCCRQPASAVLLLTRPECHDEVRARVSDHGVFTVPKPVSRAMLLRAMDWMCAVCERLNRLKARTSTMEERMDEIRVINRAKLLLISAQKMTEEQAHHCIVQSAMDKCITKKEAAQLVILDYS